VIVHVKDVPGFLVNRIWVLMAAEAEWAVAQGDAKSNFAVDSAVRYKMGLPMGLLEIDDILQGGAIDTRYHVMEHFRDTLGPSYGPSPLTEKAFRPVPSVNGQARVSMIGLPDRLMRSR
jgi:enoyl-CoA hydratase/3-hydroxyacyl-CoA dehydrogenase